MGRILSACCLFLVAAFCLNAALGSSEFSYQGRLVESDRPATGRYDFQFRIFDDSAQGNAVGLPLTVSSVLVSNGLFTVALDFGTNVFDGRRLWLDIAVRTNNSAVFTSLTPRQPIAPTPYALHSGDATRALVADSVPWTNLLKLPTTNSVQASDQILMINDSPGGGPRFLKVDDLKKAFRNEGLTNSNTLLVDWAAGDDATAQRGRMDRPWKTVTNAIASARDGDTVKINSGRYTNTLQYNPWGQAILITQKNLTIQGAGPSTELYAEGPGNHITAYDCVGLRLRDFAVIGNKPAGSAGHWLTNGLCAAINVTGAHTKDVIIERLVLKNHLNHGISTTQETNPKDVTVRFCYFENGGATNGVAGLGSDGPAMQISGQNWSLHDNVITNWARGVEIYSSWHDIRGAVVTRNRILGVPWQGIISGPENGKSIIGAKISDNIIEGNYELQALHGGAVGIVIYRHFENGIISGNVLSRLKSGGILVHSSDFSRNSISGNSIFGCDFAIGFYDANASGGIAHNSIIHNHIDSIGIEGIGLHGINNIVSFNQITRFGTNAGSGFGIRLFPNTNVWNAVIGNIIADGLTGIYVEGPNVLTNRIINNHFSRVSTPLADFGTGTIVRDNTK